jgi:hypothetical protein
MDFKTRDKIKNNIIEIVGVIKWNKKMNRINGGKRVQKKKSLWLNMYILIEVEIV